MNKIKVLIVDDSAVVRSMLTQVFGRSPEIEVVGTAIDPIIAVQKIKKFKPDVLTLDVEMPRMDGLTFLEKLMASSPMPVIMVSSLTEKGARETLKAIELGALEFICKPKPGSPEESAAFEQELIEKVLMTRTSKLKRRTSRRSLSDTKDSDFESVIPKRDPRINNTITDKVVAIGASTGGVTVIEKILSEVKDHVPGIVITQHMPPMFTREFANRVNRLSPLFVKEAENGEKLYHGMALIAPGGKHMLLRRRGKEFYVELNDGQPVNRFKPSVDVLFRSVSQAAGNNAAGIICTGMGRDGADGLLEMKEAGAYTIAQDEASCSVYGMPREAMLNGAAQKQTDIDGIVAFINAIEHD